MIAPAASFGRSYKIHSINIKPLTIILFSLIFFLSGNSAVFAIGESGWYTTKVKFEYQYSDYDQYRYYMPTPEYPETEYQYFNPYIVDFPEHRSLAKVTQSFGPMNALEIRYEISDMTADKNQYRYFGRFDHDFGGGTILYGSYQYLDTVNDNPDSSAGSGGYMVSLGAKHDRSGWIKGETSLSLDRNKTSDGLVTNTVIPMAQLRWSINSVTALSGRWDGYFAENDSGSFPSSAFTMFLSRYFYTQTAAHIFCRYYWNDSGLESISPSIELAQYIRWNLTLRLTYRYYENSFDDDAVPDFIDGTSITANSLRAYLEWEVVPALKMHLKLRRYFSNQNIEMNTYLLGFEYEL